jgi:hypothetical protein
MRCRDGQRLRIALKGLAEERKPVFAGGVAVLRSVFETLGIEHLQVSDYALREGLIYDLMGRSQQGDVRERTVDSLCRQFQIDQEHADRVRKTALALYRQLAVPWSLQEPNQGLMLAWAARLHEIGVMVVAQPVSEARRLSLAQCRSRRLHPTGAGAARRTWYSAIDGSFPCRRSPPSPRVCESRRADSASSSGWPSSCIADAPRLQTQPHAEHRGRHPRDELPGRLARRSSTDSFGARGRGLATRERGFI